MGLHFQNVIEVEIGAMNSGCIELAQVGQFQQWERARIKSGSHFCDRSDLVLAFSALTGMNLRCDTPIADGISYPSSETFTECANNCL